jgi:hypothetical protein
MGGGRNGELTRVKGDEKTQRSHLLGENFFENEGKTAQTERKRNGSMFLGFLKYNLFHF